MVLFNSDTAPKKWYCQGFNGCILFSLINGGYISEYITKPHLAKDSVIVIDPKIHDGFNRIAVSDLEGARIIKPENIHCDAKIQNIFFDFCSNPREMLDSLRRREFSEKMAELIKRLDHISFTEHDYNKFIKQSKFFLESLDKEHYRYEL